VQEYWPARLLSVLKILRVAILSKNDVWTFELSFSGLPSLNQDTEIGSDPLMAHSKTTGNPTVSCMSRNCRENDGGSFCSVGTGLKQWILLDILNLLNIFLTNAYMIFIKILGSINSSWINLEMEKTM
jgi:hypothetical protein